MIDWIWLILLFAGVAAALMHWEVLAGFLLAATPLGALVTHLVIREIEKKRER